MVKSKIRRTYLWSSVVIVIVGVLIFYFSSNSLFQHSTAKVLSQKIFLMGGGTFVNNPMENNKVFQSFNGSLWNLVQPNALWTRRTLHTSFVFNNRLWVLGGVKLGGGYQEFNDVYSSPDGVNWTLILASAPWNPRLGHTSVAFNGAMYIMGGSSFALPAGPRTFFNDVWRSTDGVNWVQVTANAPWAARQGHTSFVFNNRIWVVGGQKVGLGGPFSIAFLNDVWSSTDGINWTQVTANAPWIVRALHVSATFNGRMWVMGGANSNTFLNDVWSSLDGINWTQATANAAWAPRQDHVAFEFGGALWIAGGDNLSQFVNTDYPDVWSSNDGITWTQRTAAIPNFYSERPTVVVFP